jgi:pimeloyl-ACP methyl ester carboxylesterase
LIEGLGLAPAYVAGNSFGSAITLRLAVRRPDLVRGVILHEPPLFSLLAGDPDAAPVLAELGKAMAVVIERLASGDHSAAIEEFMQMALAPREWEQLPREFHQTVTENALTFLDETRDPEVLHFDLAWAKGLTSPTLISVGEQSPSHYSLILEKLAAALPHAKRLTFSAAGHIPHVTHPAAYVEATTGFIQKQGV